MTTNHVVWKYSFKQNKKTPDELGVFRKVFGGAAENRTLSTFAFIRLNAEILAFDWHEKSALPHEGTERTFPYLLIK